jgi:putative membrane protein
MNALSSAIAAALLAAASTVAVAQTPSQVLRQMPTDPGTASSPYQLAATDTGAPGASTVRQHQAMKEISGADTGKATAAGATPSAFAAAAAEDGETEVALGGLALRKSSNDQVRKFAQKMVQDHGQANQELESIVKRQGLILPTKLDEKHEAMVRSLEAKSGVAFDKAYAELMAKDQANAVAMYESASNSSDPDLAAFAKKSLPTLQEHEQLADNLRALVETRTRTASAR